MFRLLIDTCVWLDLAKDPSQRPLIAALQELIKEKRVSLLVPRIVVDEFKRNEERIGKESTQSLRSVLKRVKDAVEEFGDPKQKRAVLAQLDNVNRKMPIKGSASSALKEIDQLLSGSNIIEPSQSILAKAATRAIEGRAPFHRNGNAIADAVIIETYGECLRERHAGLRFAFVTHNTRDFSEANGDTRRPHPGIAQFFSKVRSLYCVKLMDALRRAEPHLVADVLFEHTFEEEPRGLTEILEALDLLFHQVWYNRHLVFIEKVRRGGIKVVEKETYPRSLAWGKETVNRSVLKMAKRAAKRVEKRYGRENLGPWDDFDWGMVNGKLSALRWVLGDEWDMLDT